MIYVCGVIGNAGILSTPASLAPQAAAALPVSIVRLMSHLGRNELRAYNNSG